jgi:hypothetical protein
MRKRSRSSSSGRHSQWSLGITFFVAGIIAFLVVTLAQFAWDGGMTWLGTHQVMWLGTHQPDVFILWFVMGWVLLFLVIGGYRNARNLDWMGIGPYPKPGTRKTAWDWLTLLGVPTVVTIVGMAIANNQHENDVKQAAIQATQVALQHQSDEKQAAQQAALAEDDQKQVLLNTLLDDYSALLLDKDHPLLSAPASDPVHIVAWARLRAALPKLDVKRKAVILNFLAASGAISDGAGQCSISSFPALLGTPVPRPTPYPTATQQQWWKDCQFPLFSSGDVLTHLYTPPLSLAAVDFMGIQAPYIDLANTNLSRVHFEGADLSHANLRYAILCATNFQNANLQGADLTGAVLNGAHFTDPTGTATPQSTPADLRAATLSGTVDDTGAITGTAIITGTDTSEIKNINIPGLQELGCT